MRLVPIAPKDLTAEQRPLYEDMKAGVSAKYKLFTTTRDDGAMLGPWNAWLHQPEIGQAFWGVTQAMTKFDKLPDAVRQIVILTVGARFRAAYEIYAHSTVAAARHHMSKGRIATLATGGRPADLTEDEAVAFDVTHALLNGGVLPEPAYRHALALFGQEGMNELIYLVGHYCFVSVTLNGFAVPVPDTDGEG
jgi:4-carboxymuconolactone decarboxylase